MQRHELVLQLERPLEIAAEAGELKLRAERGAILAVTEMQPWPPCAMKPSAVASSPESCTNSVPIAARCWLTRAMLAVASLTPAMFDSLDSRAMVSTDMSTMLRPGML